MLRKVPILVQLITGISIILISVVFVTVFFSYSYSAKVVLEKSTRFLLESVVQLRGKMDVMLQEYDRLSQMIAFDPIVQDHLRAIEQGEPTSMSTSEINRFLANKSRYVGTEFAIHLFDMHGGMYWSNESLALYWRSQGAFRNESWYSQVNEHLGRTLWMFGPAWRNGKIDAVIGARRLNDWNSLEQIGDLFMVIPLVFVERIIEDAQLDSRKIQVFDEMGQIIYSTESDDIGTTVHDDLLNKFQQSPDNIFEWNDGDNQTYISYSQSDYNGWIVAAYIDQEDALQALNSIRQSALLISTFGILAALMLLVFFSRSLVRPISHLAMRLGRVERGNLIPFHGHMMNRESYVLYTSFNNMVQHLDQTIKDLSERQVSEKRAQINALKAQFNPHFLYNTLNTIYWELINEGNDHAANMVLTLSELMRYSITPGSEQVTVHEDLEQLKRFIALQQERYGDKLKIEISADEKLMNQKVMKLLLQPLVENAITHGLETIKRKRWIIRVKIAESEGHLTFVVEDNGIGMSSQEMKRVLHMDREEPTSMHSGLGLANLQQRIELIYGGDYGIDLSQSELGGLRVRIRLPMKEEIFNAG